MYTYIYIIIHIYICIYECKYVSIHVCMKRFIQKKHTEYHTASTDISSIHGLQSSKADSLVLSKKKQNKTNKKKPQNTRKKPLKCNATQ